jgi:formate-dependent nitrite reductase membrane component NrfD
LHFFGRPADRPLVRLGYYLALSGALVSGFLLTADLTRPERFWHMLVQSHTWRPMFKAWSPMSVGAWGVLLFGVFALLATVSVLAEDQPAWKPLHSAPVRALGRRLPAAVIAAGGALAGLFLAGYTGVLLSVTNRPIWADSNLLGLLFLISGASTGAAALILLSVWRRQGHPDSLGWLVRFDRSVLGLELVVLFALLLSLGSVARLWLSWWGILLLLGVVGLGIVVPLVLERPARHGAGRRLLQAAALVLVGGFLLRVVVVLSSEQVHVLGSGVTRP